MARPQTNTLVAPQSYHDALAATLQGILSPERVIRDPLRTLAYGTDASFYRLIPQVVVVVDDEREVQELLRLSRMYGTPVTFRAAGTSLSGQAVTDSVLAVLGDGWNAVTIAADASTIRLKPGVIGAEANRRLAPYGRKIGPDPASINACKIGGIAANNASGMCCGTAQNSYRTLASMRIILADGTLLDTGDAQSRADFAESHPAFLRDVAEMGEQTRADGALADRIRRKFSIKNTCGYSLNALVDFTDPFDIIQHLMIGSEGTLGFISEVTYNTVPEYADKASALILFPTVVDACEAVIRLKRTPVAAVELMDRASLRSVEDKPGMPDFIRGLSPTATALLVETRAENRDHLAHHIEEITAGLAGLTTLFPVEFTDKPTEFERLWNIRKGLFPSVGAMREVGTTVIIEDIAFPIENLAAATAALQDLFQVHGYGDSIIFGHALEGNLHFVITPDLGRPKEVERYARFMDELCDLVVGRFDGALKAEHGTGRNIAPFVEREWGEQAYQLMRSIKALFDPEGLLNPGVILNDDPLVHLQNLKPLPAADPLVDKCMECGFCERMCPSQGLTLTPRQRIVGWREISRLGAESEWVAQIEMRNLYAYQGVDTCAACGLCATACPVGIETGSLIKLIRGNERSSGERSVANWVADHFGTTTMAMRFGLGAASTASRVLGVETLEGTTRSLRRMTGDRVPTWDRTMPTAASLRERAPTAGADSRPAVVYFPSCASRTMGPAVSDPEKDALPSKTAALLEKAGYRVIYPRGLASLCCGQPFESKGLNEIADRKSEEVRQALAEASRDGELPIVSDTSPCSYRLKRVLPPQLRPLDLVEFIHDALLERLTLTRKHEPVAVHVTCSGRKMGLEGKLKAIAAACSETVIAPEGVGCCGWAGDKGFHTPELNAHALRSLKDSLPADCAAGYSNSRTCEIGLSKHAERPYRSIVYLVDACSTGRS
jgi:FAD/FMN-containing dehydrogenases